MGDADRLLELSRRRLDEDSTERQRIWSCWGSCCLQRTRSEGGSRDGVGDPEMRWAQEQQQAVYKASVAVA